MTHLGCTLLIAALALAMILAGEVVDLLEERAERRRQDDVLLATHDVETLPGGHLLHLAGCWCRQCEPAGVPRNARHRPRRPVPTQDAVPPPPPR